MDITAGEFFDPRNAKIHLEWLRAKNASRPNLHDPTFLIHNKTTKGPPVTKEREKTAEVLKELDHMITELPKYAIIKFVGCDETTFNKMQLIQARAVQIG